MTHMMNIAAAPRAGPTRFLPVLMLLLLIVPPPLFAQPLDLRFEHMTTENGLSQDVVTCLHRDRLGYLWIGTEDGLNRYDGYSITSYKIAPERGKGLPNNTVRCIEDFGNDDLLLAMSGKLMLYDRGKDTLLNPSGALARFASRECTSILRDRDGLYWLVSAYDELVRYDPATDSCRSFAFAHDASSPPFRRGIWAIFIDSEDSLWVGTDSALALFRRASDDFTFFPMRNLQDPDPGHLIPTAMTEDSAHDLWIGTKMGVYRFDRGRRTFQFVRFDGRHSPFEAEEDYIIGGFQWDRSGRLWMGGFSGLYCVDPRTGRAARYGHVENDPASLRNSRVYALYCDPSDVLWVGTWHGGLNKVDFKKDRFGFVRNAVPTPLAGNSSDVVAVCEDTAGNAWLASRAGGLTRIDRATTTFTPFVHDPQRPASITGGELSSLTADADGSLWIASASALDHYDPRSGLFRHLRVPGVDGKLKNILTIYCDTRDHLWIGVEHFGAVRLDKSTGTYAIFNDGSADTSWRGFSGCWAFYEDREGNMWLGGWSGSLDLYCIRDSSHRRLDSSHPLRDPTHQVIRYRQPQLRTARSFAEDRDGDLWVGTWGQGVTRLNPRTGEMRQFTEQDGLPNNFVKGIIPDNGGDLWISTELGISRYSPASGTFKNFDVHDGLQGNFFYTSSCWKGKHGTLYFGGVNGLNAFNPDSIRDEEYEPPVIFTGFKVLDRNRPADRPLSRLTRVQLSSSEDMFSFEYASLDLTAPERNRYAYMLQGFDREWIDAGTRRFASYTHLDPGEYVFNVRGTNSDGKWSAHIAQLHVIILPAFWETWWFSGAAALAIGAALYGVYRYRLNKLLQVEHTRAAIATDLHDDIGATLTSIALFSDLARHELLSNAPQAIGRLQRIAELSRTLLDKMNDIVWAINPENDSLEHLLLRMKEVAATLFDARGIEYEITMPDGVPGGKLPMTARRNLYLVYKEILHNAAKHSAASIVHIRVAFPHGDDALFELEVRDNGSGFDVARVKRGNGLNSIGRRAAAMNAQYEIDSSPGKGTRVRLRLPVKSLV